jgi:hypothetical protein
MKLTKELAIIIFDMGLLVSVIPLTLTIMKGSEFLIGFASMGIFLGIYLLDDEITHQQRNKTK